MKYDPNKRVPDQLRDIWLTTKEDVLIWLKGEMERVTDQSRMDKKHSAAFYYAYTKLLTRFYKEGVLSAKSDAELEALMHE